MHICENIIAVWSGQHEYLHLNSLIRFRTLSDYYQRLDSANFTCKAHSALDDRQSTMRSNYTITLSWPGIRIHEHSAHSSQAPPISSVCTITALAALRPS
ncbi:hypothetical protein HGRIS_001161 [Hohenbuehelia grisea]|uniref:Uncharacterized protein n=1 Tax=Hohenbuehelia grisea TaxID=104357 RepID=A0ABR3JNN4_9AGAR